MSPARRIASNCLGLLGASLGGALGYYTFGWLVSHGFYGLMIPGGLLGFGCGLLSQHPSPARGLACASLAFALALFAESQFRPWIADASLRYFVAHMGNLNLLTWLMAVAGSFLAYWLGKDSFYSVLEDMPDRSTTYP